MHRVAVVAVLGLAFAATAVAGSFPLERARTPQSLLRLQVDLYNRGDWANYWLTYSASFRKYYNRAACIEQFEEQRGTTNPHGTVRNIKVRLVKPTRALLSYYIEGAFGTEGQVRGDVYVKKGSRWYDELDPNTGC